MKKTIKRKSLLTATQDEGDNMSATNMIKDVMKTASKAKEQFAKTPVGHLSFAAVAKPVLNKFNPDEEAKYKVALMLDNDASETAEFRKEHAKLSGRSLTVDDANGITRFNAKSLGAPKVTIQGEAVEHLAAEQDVDVIDLLSQIFDTRYHKISATVEYSIFEGKKGKAVVLKAIDVINIEKAE